jgi:hypothetical protein
MILLNIFLILLASTSDAIMDTISSHFPTSVFSNSSDWKIVQLNRVGQPLVSIKDSPADRKSVV